MSSKGLEALKEIKKQVGNIHYFDFSGDIPKQTSYELREMPLFSTIEKELKEYESYKGFLDNVEKGIVTYTPRDTWEEERKKLKRLEELEKAFDSLSKENEKIMKELSKEIEKNRALEIIKNKEINVHALFLHLKRFDKPDGYNVLVGTKYQITQEEYDLLKEVLK